MESVKLLGCTEGCRTEGSKRLALSLSLSCLGLVLSCLVLSYFCVSKIRQL